ncbi:MAG: Gfo/Idh/MocA family oxidoreductase [Gammaproteobacteria bacterium]|nr:Gfo/Idh/MocA family oxidoreductase [Gammaproteobacteria bacterium]
MSKQNTPITDRKIKWALVGCGRIADKHFEAIEKHADNIDLVAVCDDNADALKKAVDRTGARGFADYDEMLRDSGADVVSITTPSGLHPDQTVAAAEAGLHVVTEKPMATRWADGKRMVKACDRAGVHLFVVKQNRRNATLQLLKRAMEKGRFGRIYMANLNVFWTRPQEYYDAASWRGTWEYDGGAFMNQASHYIDLLTWIIGPVESVYSQTATLERNIQAEDTGVISLKWRSGALGSVNVTMLTYPKNFEGSITIIGEKGTVRVGGVAVNEVQHWEFEDSDPDDELVKQSSYETTSVYGFGHPLYYENVVDVLRGKARPETDGREGLKSLELLIASYLSARDKRPVSLPLEY